MTITLEEVQQELGNCKRCELCETRTTIVFGVGNPHAEVMFIGEAPGKQEDLGAEPFIGAAGKYLNELLAIAGLERKDVYIANVLKCRPPGNADPLPHQIETCTPFLRNQVRAIEPLVLVTLGRFASQFILKTDTGISHLRGKVHITGRYSVLPIYHPAAAIYDRNKRPILEQDFELLRLLIEKRHEELGQRNARKPAGTTVSSPSVDESDKEKAGAELPAEESGKEAPGAEQRADASDTKGANQ